MLALLILLASFTFMLLVTAVVLSVSLHLMRGKLKEIDTPTPNPLFIRCSCSHLATGHGAGGYYDNSGCKECKCGAPYSLVVKHGTFDSNLYLTHTTEGEFGGHGPRHEVVRPTQVLTSGARKSSSGQSLLEVGVKRFRQHLDLWAQELAKKVDEMRQED